MVPEIILETIQLKFNQRIRYPKDCESLSREINKTSTSKISATTISRIFNLRNDGSKPTLRTLDVIAEYIGFESWQLAIEFSIENSKQLLKGSNQPFPYKYTVNAIHEITECNYDFAKILQYSIKEIMELKIIDLLDINSIRNVMNYTILLEKGNKVTDYVGSFIQKNGETIFLIGILTPHLKDGILESTDVELTKLITSEKKFEYTEFKNCVILDHEWKIKYNSEVNSVLNDNPSNKSFIELIPEVDNTRFFELFILCICNDKRITFTEKFKLNENEFRWYKYTLMPFEDGVGVYYTRLFE